MIGSMIQGREDITSGEALVDELCRDLDLAERSLPPAVLDSVVAATRAFVATDGHSDDAVRLVRPTLMRLGRRAAVRGHTAARLSTDLQRVVDDRARQAEHMISRLIPDDEVDGLRCRLTVFLRHVQHAALAGHRQAHTMMALGPAARRHMMARALFASEAVPDDLLAIAGIPGDTPYVPLVWVCGSRGAIRATAELPDALVDSTGRAALVPLAQRGDVVLEEGDRVVEGPPRPARELGDSLRLAHQAADAMRAGVIPSDRQVTPCADVAAELLLAGRPVLKEILVAKYLTGFQDLKPARRVEIAEVLLTWLQTREPLSAMAQRHHVARQTAHDRLRIGKQLLGDALDDTSAHAAIVVALHASLPAWREEKAARAARRGASRHHKFPDRRPDVGPTKGSSVDGGSRELPR